MNETNHMIGRRAISCKHGVYMHYSSWVSVESRMQEIATGTEIVAELVACIRCLDFQEVIQCELNWIECKSPFFPDVYRTVA